MGFDIADEAVTVIVISGPYLNPVAGERKEVWVSDRGLSGALAWVGVPDSGRDIA